MEKRLENFFCKFLPEDYIIKVYRDLRRNCYVVVFFRETGNPLIKQGGGFYIKDLREAQKNSWLIMQSLKNFWQISNNNWSKNAIYEIRDKIVPILKENGIKYTELKPEQSFEYTMFEKPVNGEKGLHYGYSWCGGRCRWGTTAKLKAIDKYCAGAKQYIGVAYDEPERVKRAHEAGKLTPLADWKMTEKDCLEYCHNRGYFWLEGDVELYDILDRVSCWCCANKNLKELRNYYKFLPDYWEKLKILQTKTKRPFKKNGTIFDLEKRFEREQSNDRHF